MKTFTLDVLMHLPRSVFSHRQLDLFNWLLKMHGVNNAPSVSGMVKFKDMMQEFCGIRTIRYKGAFGSTYYVNSLEDIVAQVNLTSIICFII